MSFFGIRNKDDTQPDQLGFSSESPSGKMNSLLHLISTQVIKVASLELRAELIEGKLKTKINQMNKLKS